MGLDLPSVHDWITKYITGDGTAGSANLWNKGIMEQPNSDGSFGNVFDWFNKMHGCFETAELQDSLFASAYTQGDASPITLSNNALSNFGSLPDVGSTTTSLDQLRDAIGELAGVPGVTSGLDLSQIKESMEDQYHGPGQLASVKAQLAAQYSTLKENAAKYSGAVGAINNQTKGSDTTGPQTVLKSITGSIAAIQSLFQGSSLAASTQQKSLQASDTAIMQLLAKCYQAEHEVSKTTISNQGKGG